MNVAIEITADDGLRIYKTDERVGSYTGTDAPSWLAGGRHPNMFCGATVKEAKELALEYLEDISMEVQEAIEMVEGVR